MTLESMLGTLRQNLKILPMIGMVSVFACAEGSTGNSHEQENQGGNGGTYIGGSAGFGGDVGLGGSDEACFPNNSMTCNNGDVYWQDSCGNLGELLQDCLETELCENNQCIYDCSMVTPISGCSEQNCSFYDTFDHGTCKWDINAGAPYTSDEKLHLNGNSIVEAKEGPFGLSLSCEGNFRAQYKAELLESAQGSLKISHRNDNPNFSGLTITHYPYGYPGNENNNIAIDCMGQIEVVGDFDLHSQKTLEVQKTGNQLNLYVDNVFTASVACNETGTATPVYKLNVSAGSAVLPQAMKIDDVTVYCSNP